MLWSTASDSPSARPYNLWGSILEGRQWPQAMSRARHSYSTLQIIQGHGLWTIWPICHLQWQRHSQDTTELAHHTALLEFLDLRVHASENWVCDTNDDVRQLLQRRCPQNCHITSTSSITVWLVNRVSIPFTPAKSSGHCHMGKWWQFLRSTGIALTAGSQDILSSIVLVVKSAGNISSR